MMQVTLGTGSRCHAHLRRRGPLALPAVLPPVRVSPQTDGINQQRIVAVAVYCRLNPECKGVVTLTVGGRQVSVGSGDFSVLANTTSHVPIRIASSLMPAIRQHDGVHTTLTAVVAGKTITQTIDVKIL